MMVMWRFCCQKQAVGFFSVNSPQREMCFLPIIREYISTLCVHPQYKLKIPLKFEDLQSTSTLDRNSSIDFC